MKKVLIIIFTIVHIIFGMAICSYAGGLSTTFVQAKVENLEPGKEYSITDLTKSLVIKNTTSKITTDIEISPENAKEYNLIDGYEPLPDISWIKVKKSYFKDVGPGEKVETEVTISIPDNKAYYGKKYQAYLYSHTAGKGTFRMGLMSRLLIHTKEYK